MNGTVAAVPLRLGSLNASPALRRRRRRRSQGVNDECNDYYYPRAYYVC